MPTSASKNAVDDAARLNLCVRSAPFCDPGQPWVQHAQDFRARSGAATARGRPSVEVLKSCAIAAATDGADRERSFCAVKIFLYPRLGISASVPRSKLQCPCLANPGSTGGRWLLLADGTGLGQESELCPYAKALRCWLLTVTRGGGWSAPPSL